MLMTILTMLNRFKFWVLLVVSIIVILSMQYFFKKEVIGLEGVISSAGVDIMACKGNLALCEQNFKSLANQCKQTCPGMAADINNLQKDYEKSKQDLNDKNKQIKEYTQELLKLRQEEAASGKIVWADTPAELQAQLQNLLGNQWSGIVERIKRDSGMNAVTATIGGAVTIANTIKKFRYYPKLKLGIGTDLSQAQAQVGVSLFSFGRDRSIEKSIVDFIEPFVAVGMDGEGNIGAAVGVIPASLNLGGILPVIKDLDIYVGGQYNFREKAVLPVFGVTSTF